MIRRLLAALLATLGLAVLADRLLGLDPFVAGAPTARPIRSRVTIDAPRETVWAAIADVPAQPLWMQEMVAVRLTSDGPLGVGTTGEADVRLLGIQVTDPVEITGWEPPRRFAIRHLGRFAGDGEILLEDTNGGGTIVIWNERLVPPYLPELGALVQRPILRAVFQGDLERLRELVESGELPRD